MRRVVTITVLALALFLVACSTGQPSISVEATNLDLGNVTNGEIVRRELVLRNEGETDLIIDSVETSCTCTQASVDPLTIPAKQSGVLHIKFDSGLHGPDLSGPLIRQVFINSNDPRQPEAVIEISIVVEERNN